MNVKPDHDKETSLAHEEIVERFDMLESKINVKNEISNVHESLNKTKTDVGFLTSDVKVLNIRVDYIEKEVDRATKSREKLHTKVDSHGEKLSATYSIVNSFIADHSGDYKNFKWIVTIITTIILSCFGVFWNHTNKQNDKIIQVLEKKVEVLEKPVKKLVK